MTTFSMRAVFKNGSGDGRRVEPATRRLLASTALLSLSAGAQAPLNLELIAERTIAPTGEFWGTIVGGISGVDYEPISDRWVMVSDGRGANGPTRAYEFGVLMNGTNLRKFQLLGKLPMNHGDGSAFDEELYDPEGVRMRPSRYFDGDDEGDPTLIWIDEGTHGAAPTIYEACMGATWMDQWNAPAQLVPSKDAGTRENLGYESLAMMPDGNATVATEDALAQDGEVSNAITGGSPVRLLHFNLDVPSSPAEWARVYQLDAPPKALGPLARTGLVELEAIDDTRLLAMERSFNMAGAFAIRLYVVDLSTGDDVLGVDSLKNTDAAPVTKTLVADLGEVPGVSLANYEGLAIGPTLDDGRRMVVITSDNNFDKGVSTRVLFLAAEGLD